MRAAALNTAITKINTKAAPQAFWFSSADGWVA
jgi:hypothetical protein